MNVNVIKSTTDNPTSVPNYHNITIDKLDQIDNNVCKSLILHDVLRFLTPPQFESVLQKMRHGGVIIIESPDILQIAKSLYWGTIDVSKFSSMLSSSITYSSIIETKTFLEQHEYSIEEGMVHLDSLLFTIRAKRL